MLALSGTPAVAAACVAICDVDGAHAVNDETATHTVRGHAAHHPQAASDLGQPERGLDAPTHHHAAEAHHHQHEAPAADAHADHGTNDASLAQHHASHDQDGPVYAVDAHHPGSPHDGAIARQAPTPRVSREPVTCCGAHETHDMGAARTPTRIDTSTAPLTPTLPPVVVPANLVTRLSEPRAGAPPPPAPTRAPLILRI